jgi:DNA-directed RNA polymerase specialized sigma24 family protein
MANSDWVLEDLLAQDAWIHALARLLVTDPHAAEDVAQDAWVEALARPPARPDRARTWFRRVVQNLAFKRSRSLKRQREREKQAARPCRLPSVAEMQERANVRIEVTRTVFSLDEPYRSAIPHL